jgi:uncharacterized membrane protein
LQRIGCTKGLSVSWRTLLALAVLVVVGAWLRFYGIGAKSLWFDEALSWQLLQFPWDEMIARTAEPYTTHPPAYFVLLRLWTGVWGDSETALRSLAAVAGLLAVVGAYFLTRELQTFPQPDAIRLAPGTPLLATCLVSLSVLHIHASQQVRSYSVGSAIYLGVCIALLRALRTGSGPAWITFSVLGLLFCYTHHLALFHLAALVLFVALYLGRQLWRPGVSKILIANGQPPAKKQALALMTTILIIALGYLPWLPSLLSQVAVARGAWDSPFGFEIIAEQTYYALTSSFAQRLPTPAWLSAVVALLVPATLFFLACTSGWPGRYLCLTGLVPLLLLVIQSLDGSRRVYEVRLLTFTQTTWLIALAYLIGRIPYALERHTMVAITIGFAAFQCVENWSTIGPFANPGVRQAVAHILANRAPDEPVLARTSFIVLGANYYTRGQTQVLLSGPEPHRLAYRNAAHLKDSEIITSDKARQLAASGVWFISTASYSHGQEHQFRLPDHWHLAWSETFAQGDYYWEFPITVEHFLIDQAQAGPKSR